MLFGALELPFAKKWLKVKANYAEYFLNDKRSVDNAHLHYKSLFFKSNLSSKLDLITGLDHHVQWGRTSQEFGKQPTSFKTYLKYITGTGDGNKTEDQINSSNAWGNHVGNYLVQLDYIGENSNWSFYWSHPFEDRSGRELMNYPDALYGFFMDFKDYKENKNKFSSDMDAVINGVQKNWFDKDKFLYLNNLADLLHSNWQDSKLNLDAVQLLIFCKHIHQHYLQYLIQSLQKFQPKSFRYLLALLRNLDGFPCFLKYKQSCLCIKLNLLNFVQQSPFCQHLQTQGK